MEQGWGGVGEGTRREGVHPACRRCAVRVPVRRALGATQPAGPCPRRWQVVEQSSHGAVHVDNDPRRLAAVHLGEVVLQPLKGTKKANAGKMCK